MALVPEGLARVETIAGAGHFAWKDVSDDVYWPVVREFVISGAAVSEEPTT